MADFLNLPIERCLVMEGSISNQECLNSLLKESKKTEKHGKNISILYSGSLNMKYGIPELIEGFGMIDADDYELWFAGTGDAKEYIESKASKDSRIKYFGYIPRREDLLDMQRNATMLFNTRLPGEKASLYCFPSKLFEFLLSGRPVLSYKIGGIPDEYFNYLIEVKSSTPCDIKNAICYVAQMSETEREKIGLAGRNYVIEEKNSLKQAKRICEFIGL